MNRTEAREWVVKMLYQYDVSRLPVSKIFENFYKDNDPGQQKEYIESTVVEVINHLQEIDKEIEKYSESWAINRMPKIDLAILRCSIYEILYREDIPISVSINEAVEIAKKYSTENSPAFINGLLGAFVRDKGLEEGETNDN
ncbi:N utilization substance protein B [Thermoanaerobacter kivui]|uniref:Transcription antitermination protein NusB n=1 Tax=Thermoanaerobacter kivui TaxID=2325 RepID=A0A097ARE0_THEKI|nr:transcription antitermination factor NusB [Thermoanaerobacter kivui]AIS52379.1 N utilization substance protein B [Thermoanaerobacter kivui]